MAASTNALTEIITTLVNAKEKPIKSVKTLRAIVKVGQAVNNAVEKFVSVGEAFSNGNPEITADMYDACKEARSAGGAIQRLTEIQYDKSGQIVGACTDKSSMVIAARALLTSVTKVLILADTIVVKKLIVSKDKVAISLDRMENVTSFTDFVKAFSQFGSEMVELAHLTGDRQNDLKDERRRAQMSSARQILERSTMMLLTAFKYSSLSSARESSTLMTTDDGAMSSSSTSNNDGVVLLQTSLRHPDSASAKENRDTVFHQMRWAIDMIHFVVKDGVIPDLGPPGEAKRNGRSSRVMLPVPPPIFEDLENDYTDIVEMTRMTLVGPSYRVKLNRALANVIECTQDFTDSAYTSHEHRERILRLCDRAKVELNQLLRIGEKIDQTEITSPSSELEQAIEDMLNATHDLRTQLQDTALEQAVDSRHLCHELDTLETMKHSAISGDAQRLTECSDRFHEQAEQLHEVCKLLWHIAHGETIQVTAKHTETNIRVLGPQVASASLTVRTHPSSKIAKENFDVFLDSWTALARDIDGIIREELEYYQGKHPEKPHYASIQRHGVRRQYPEAEKHGSTTKTQNPVKLDCEEQAKIAKLGLEMKLLTSEIDAETEKWDESENNDIVKRAKNMSSMAFSMYQFTRGEGILKTTQYSSSSSAGESSTLMTTDDGTMYSSSTSNNDGVVLLQDLFTQAEYFAEDANKLYKLVRQFSYQVPGSPQKHELLEYLDKVPTYVQQLQYTVKNPTVGKAATFTKVDNVIQETKNLMNVISKVVSTCFVCATKYNLDFQGVSGGSSGRSSQNNLSPMSRMDTMDDSGITDGSIATNAPGGSLNKPSNGQSASDPNI
ncbi:Alpha-catulin [Nymphon striatum]|nr:Alpha-catulin [Nymphon striatum]